MNGSTRRPSLPLLAILATALGFAAVPAAGAATGEVVLKFHEAKAKVEDTDTVLHNSNDFYPVVDVEGVPGVLAVRDGRDHAKWEKYEVRATVDTTLRFYNATVNLREEDDGPDDVFDIHPTSPNIGYNFTFDACTLRYQDGDLLPILGREAGPGKETNLPFGNGDGDGGAGGVDYDAKVTITITTGDGNPFTTDDVAIAEADPVQAPYGAEKIIEDKPLSFMVKLTSTFDHTVQADVTVTLDDGIAPRTDVKTVTVPTSGRTLFLFDDDPYIPKKNPADPVLRYEVVVEPPEESFSPDDCETINNALYGYTLPIVTTVDRLTVYRPFDAPIAFGPADIITPAELETLYDTSEIFRKAVYPLASLNSTFNTTAIVTRTVFPFDNVESLLTYHSTAAATAGIDRMILVPRRDSMNDVGLDAPGVSLGESAPRAVFVEHDTDSTAAHEIGHTFKLSQRNCSNGGIGEALFGTGCRDEYEHPSPPRPYIASGFDVEGTVRPGGLGGAAGTREIITNNFMDTNPGFYSRWVDDFTYNFLADTLRDQADPALIQVWGRIQAVGGLDADPVPTFNGELYFGYRFEGLPDRELPSPGISAGEGRFEIRLETGQETYRYRLNPGYAEDITGSGDEYGYFSLALPWPAAGVASIELWGPSDVTDELVSADTLLFARFRTNLDPVVTALGAGVDVGPPQGGPQPEPPTIGPGHEAVVGWDVSDADSAELRTVVHLRPPPVAGEYDGWLPMAVELDNNEYRIPHEWLANKPGLYGGRVLVSDGINTAAYQLDELFEICNSTNGGIEVCDGLDNDCDGEVDNAALPPASMELSVTRADLSWTNALTADKYDVVRGDLVGLVGSGGDFTAATDGCVASGTTTTSIPYNNDPLVGQGFWFVVRGLNCVGAGTYNSSGAPQVGDRDSEIDLSPNACP